MDAAFVEQLRQLLTARTGLHLRDREMAAFRSLLLGRLQALRMSGMEGYYRLVSSNTSRGLEEWKQLVDLWTNQESYFFRDKGQFALLARTILPELLERNQEHRTLRLWSAACSTGEEPYSLAMLVDQLLPQRTGWRIRILGTDINESGLEKAQRGVYSPWSFRMVDPGIQKQFFDPRGGDWELHARIRSMVRFLPLNLVDGDFPNPATELCDMDLIVCRNVFIYFRRDALPPILQQMARTLREGGYLMTGHSELHDVQINSLKSRLFPESVVYQHHGQPVPVTPPLVAVAPIAPIAPVALPPLIAPRAKPVPPVPPRLPSAALTRAPVRVLTAPTTTPTDEAILKSAQAALDAGHAGAALEALEPLLQRGVEEATPSLAALCLAAHVHANRGELEKALMRCREAAQAHPLAPAPYHLMAHIAEEQGDIALAKTLLKKVIYLAPTSAAAYLELAQIYEREGDARRATTMRATAAQLGASGA